MTATGVIEEIKHLPRAEQSRVIQFALELARERQLSGDQLTELAQRLAEARDPAEAGKLREEIHRGFSGMTVCGEGELIRTFLQPGQGATGDESP